MRQVAAIRALLVAAAGRRTHDEPLRLRPPREGMRPGTASGNPQTPF